MVDLLIGFVTGVVCAMGVVALMAHVLEEREPEDKRTEVHQRYDPGIAVGHYCRDCKHRHESQHIPCDKLFKVNCTHFEWKEDQDGQ